MNNCAPLGALNRTKTHSDYTSARAKSLTHTHAKCARARQTNARANVNNLATLFSGYSINLVSISEKSGRTRYEHFTNLRWFLVCRIGANDYFNKVTKYINKKICVYIHD